MNIIFKTTLILFLVFVSSFNSFAQSDPNPFTDPNVNQETSLFTDPNLNQDQNPNTETNVNNQNNANYDYSFSEININSDINENSELNANLDNNSNTEYNFSEWYENQDIYAFDGEWNPFLGDTHNKYDPWEQPTFNGEWTSFTGDVNSYNKDQTQQYKYTGEGVYGTYKEKQYEGIFSKAKDTNKFVAGQNLFDSDATTNLKACVKDFKTFKGLILYVVCVINSFLVQIVISIGLVYFIWGIMKVVMSTDNVEERKKAKEVLIYSVIAIFVMVSVWGIIRLFKITLGI